jgi:hypothetical protein
MERYAIPCARVSMYRRCLLHIDQIHPTWKVFVFLEDVAIPTHGSHSACKCP